ncbi:MAG: hypothetical protein WDN69_10930 [Aliidongia sp.]
MVDELLGIEQEIVDDDDRQAFRPDTINPHPKVFMQEGPDSHPVCFS